MRRLMMTAFVLLTCGFAGMAHAQPFWEDGTFVSPVPKSGSFIVMDSGERFAAWQVVGQSGNATWLSGAFVHHGFNFTAQAPGHETTDIWVNLAGMSQSATGIAHHPVATTVGANYTLSFYVGNLYDPGGVYGTSSTIGVYENSKLLGHFTNSDGQGSMNENWKFFTITFPADAAFTTIAFINEDPPGDLNCGLDNTSFAPATPA